MKKLLFSAGVLLLCLALLFGGISAGMTASMPPYRDSVGNDNYTEKITGLYLVEQSAAREDNILIYGSSELRTLEIPTHPVNFFMGKRADFQVNIVGRGSCQSLIHALSIAATGDALTGKKVVLITSPQSYVAEGIAPDLFMANFSPQQYLTLLADPDLSAGVKEAISGRVRTLFARYEALPDAEVTDPAIRWLAEHESSPNALTAARNAALTPYYAASRGLLSWKDRAASRMLIESVEEPLPAARHLSLEEEEANALLAAENATDNNDFGILNDYYNTYIGNRLSRFEGRDSGLSYSVSEEYGDLRILLEVCREKGIEPLFIHVPLHGPWSDYTGFTAERRAEYYQNVRNIVAEYDNVALLDLTGYEYEEYFLCDIMHLGWRGWLEVDQALIEYYNEN